VRLVATCPSGVWPLTPWAEIKVTSAQPDVSNTLCQVIRLEWRCGVKRAASESFEAIISLRDSFGNEAAPGTGQTLELVLDGSKRASLVRSRRVSPDSWSFLIQAETGEFDNLRMKAVLREGNKDVGGTIIAGADVLAALQNQPSCPWRWDWHGSKTARFLQREQITWQWVLSEFLGEGGHRDDLFFQDLNIVDIQAVGDEDDHFLNGFEAFCPVASNLTQSRSLNPTARSQRTLGQKSA
jgi:hypothetical protein